MLFFHIPSILQPLYLPANFWLLSWCFKRPKSCYAVLKVGLVAAFFRTAKPFTVSAKVSTSPWAQESQTQINAKYRWIIKHRCQQSTLPETNISPENGPLEKEIPIGNHQFRGYVSLRESIFNVKQRWGVYVHRDVNISYVNTNTDESMYDVYRKYSKYLKETHCHWNIYIYMCLYIVIFDICYI